MHDGMSFDPIQGQGHRASEVPIIALFEVYLRHLQWQLANDHWFLNYSTISKFDRARFLLLVLVFVSRDLELGGVPAVSPSTKVFFPISMKFDMCIELDEWCRTVCRMTRSKVKAKVTSAWKPLRRRRPSVPHGTNVLFILKTFEKWHTYIIKQLIKMTLCSTVNKWYRPINIVPWR